MTLIRLEHTLFSDENEHHPDPDSDDDDYKSDAPKLPYTPPQKSRQLQPPLLHTFNQPTNNGYGMKLFSLKLSNQRNDFSLQPNECGTTHAKYNFRHLIVGGENVQRGSWPWLVAIYLRGINELAFSCGGNLISARTVVTAAHCIRTPKGTYSHHDLVLYLGLHNINDRRQTGVQESEVEEIHIHNDFMSKDSSYDADIALIIMPRRLEFTEFIRPICLWDNSDDLSNIQRQLGTVIGWGKDGSGDVLSPEPKRITMPIVSDGECLRSSNTYRYITSDRTYCAGARDGRGPCHGDSGGGMTFKINKRWTLRGIVSAGNVDRICFHCVKRNVDFVLQPWQIPSIIRVTWTNSSFSLMWRNLLIGLHHICCRKWGSTCHPNKYFRNPKF